MTERVADSFEPIPMPTMLADEPLKPTGADAEDASADDLRKVNQGLERQLTIVSDYARQLWTELSRVSDYLREDIARGTSGAGVLASDDDWTHWQQAYSGALQRLAGPRGDHGYADYQATMERRHRFGPH